MQQQTVGGVDIQYLMLCKRKLWLYKKGIRMESESDQVALGHVLHENAYPRLERREIMVDEGFKIDLMDGEYVREIKLSSSMTEADRMQMLFYLYQLSLRGIQKKGLISYTKEKRTEEVELKEEDKPRIARLIREVYEIIQQPMPPAAKKLPYCKSCAYYAFCFAHEVDQP